MEPVRLSSRYAFCFHTNFNPRYIPLGLHFVNLIKFHNASLHYVKQEGTLSNFKTYLQKHACLYLTTFMLTSTKIASLTNIAEIVSALEPTPLNQSKRLSSFSSNVCLGENAYKR